MSARLKHCLSSTVSMRDAARLTLTSLVMGMGLATSVARADIVWNWSYSGTGVAAGGTLVTGSQPTVGGWYTVTSLTGQRNGVAILGLQPAGTAIPGNESYPVDNLIQQADPLLSFWGLGYALNDGTFANVYADAGSGPGGTAWFEYFSAAPFVADVMGPEDGERSITSISLTPLDVPPSLLLLSLGLGGLGLFGGSRRLHDAPGRYRTPD